MFEVFTAWTPSFPTVNAFFLSSVSRDFIISTCMNKSTTYSEVWDYLMECSGCSLPPQESLQLKTTSSTTTPSLLPDPVCSFSITQAQAPLLILRRYSPHLCYCLFIFPSPSLSRNSPVCQLPSLAQNFSLPSSTRATKPLFSTETAGYRLHALCLVQKAAGRGRSILGLGQPLCAHIMGLGAKGESCLS